MAEVHTHGLGSGGYCVCPKCGAKVRHSSGHPCQQQKCSVCGAKMLREGSAHHQLFEEKKKKRQEKKKDLSK